MSIPNEYLDICEMLIEATNDGRVNWIEKSGTFVVRLPDYYFEIWSGSDDQNEEFVAIGLKDPSERGLLDNWYLNEGDPHFDKLQTLWRAARRHAYRLPEKLEALRRLLRSGEKVGLEDDKTRKKT